ncbi:hypothetical protein P4S72_30000 [Vibrio sp. PP-XX7]
MSPEANHIDLKRNINASIRKLPPEEMTMPTRTMVLFDLAAPRMKDSSKVEVLQHVQSLMAQPAAQRNEGMRGLHQLLRDITKGEKL